MLEQLTEEEIEISECLYNPIALAETLFSDYDNLAAMEDYTLANVRIGQLPLLSYEYFLDEDENLSRKENFQLRKGAGDIYCFGGRLFGKSLLVEKVDIMISMIALENERVGFTSYDAIHVRGILEDIVNVLERHPFFRLFEPNINRSPNYRITLSTGYLLESVNMNIQGKNPGKQFYQKHFTRLYIEEASLETEEVYKMRRDSVSELGCVFRISGMTNFTKYSPCGKIFYDTKLKVLVVNLPQYVNPNWNDKEKEKAVKDFGGEQSIGFRIFIKGLVVEDGVSVFDMQRIRNSYFEDRKLKIFEVSKDNFLNFENIVFVERPKNADNVFIFADIGESAPTEIGIIFEINKKYRYVYNITLYNLTDKEQYKFFKWLLGQVNANFISIDCTDGTGRSIYRSLEEVFDKKHIVWCSFNEKIPIDFEKDDQGNVVFKNGSPVYIEEYVSEWSIKHLKDLFYGDRMEMPFDYKLDLQLNSVIAMQSGTRTIYNCVSQENHLFQAFQVWSILQWMCEFMLVKPVVVKIFGKTGV